jgi:hypothetical protein
VNWVASNGQNAMVVPPQDVPAWSAALAALAASPARARCSATSAMSATCANSTSRVTAADLRTVYELALRIGSQEPRRARTGDRGQRAPRSSRQPVPRGFPDRLLVVIPR